MLRRHNERELQSLPPSIDGFPLDIIGSDGISSGDADGLSDDTVDSSQDDQLSASQLASRLSPRQHQNAEGNAAVLNIGGSVVLDFGVPMGSQVDDDDDLSQVPLQPFEEGRLRSDSFHSLPSLFSPLLASSPSPVSSCSEQDGVRFRRLSLDTVSTASSVSTSVSTSVSSHFADLTTPTHALGTRKEEEAVLGFKRPISAAAKKQKLRTLRHRQRWRGFLFCLLHERFRKFAPSLVYTLLTSRPLLVVGDDADTVSATVSALAHLLPGVSMLANHVPLWNQPVSNDSTSSSSDSVNHIDHISRIDGVPLRLRQVPAPTLDDMARHRLIGITRGSFDRLVMRRRSVRESIALLDLDENSLLAPEYPVRYFANGGGSKVGGTGSTGDGGTGQHRKRSLVLQLLGRASRFPNESTFLLFLERHLLELQLKAFVYWHMALQGIEPSQLSQRLQRYARPASTSNKVVLDRSVMEKLLSVGRPDLAILENLARVLLHQQQLHAAGVSLFAQLRGLPVQTKLRIPTLLLPHELHRTRKDEGSPNHAT